MPKVSVNIAVYNGEHYLRECLNSILNQDYADFEVVVVDDGSNDSTSQILEEYRVKDQRIRVFTNSKNEGVAFSRNRALAESAGEYIAVMDADDISLPERLRIQANFLDRNTQIALVGSNADFISEVGEILEHAVMPVESNLLRWKLFFFNPFIHTSIVLRRNIMQKVGGYSSTYEVAQDYDLIARISLKHDIANIAQCTVKYREWRAGISKTKKDILLRDCERVMSYLIQTYLDKPIEPYLISELRKLFWREQISHINVHHLANLLLSIYYSYKQSINIPKAEERIISKEVSLTLFQIALLAKNESFVDAFAIGLKGFRNNPNSLVSVAQILWRKI